MGFPVVMKVVSPQILHKSDVGGVVLHIDSEEKAKEAFWHLEKIAEGRDFQGAVLYPMLKGGREVILGLTRDPMFGPVVAFGLGGVYYGGVKRRRVPRRAGQRTAGNGDDPKHPVLPHFTGHTRRGAGGFSTHSQTRLPRFPSCRFLEPGIQEADLNPVFVFEDKILTADARILYAKKEG